MWGHSGQGKQITEIKDIKFMKIIFIILSALITGFCTCPTFADNDFTISGIMQHSDLEGGCWYLQAKQTKYELTASSEILRICHVEGRSLVLRVHQAKMMASICMIGHMVEVTEVLDTLFHPHNPPFIHKRIKGTVRKNKSGCWYVMGTDKLRYELQSPIPKKFMHTGIRYNRISTVLPGSESECGMNAVITISMLDPDLKPKTIKEKKSDPR